LSKRLRAIVVLVAAGLVAAGLVAGCSAGPVSQATSIPTTGAPAGDASPSPAAAPSAGDTEAPPPTEPPAPTEPAATPIDVPPKPGDPTFALVKETPKAGGGSTVEYEITWTSPAGLASQFLAYGVTECLRYSKKYDDKPCLVKGMKIPRTSLALIGRAPGDARKMTVTWDLDEAGPGPYSSILIRATNSFGDSIFTIVQTEKVCYQCTY
jgi:hypothetical protein